ncbi:MAG: cysteine peptidase family C39 domain-containing protein [Candidatus Falkowbacteria bacterium]
MAIIKDFPELRQAYEYDCGANALQSVLVYYGFDIRESQVMKLAKTTKKDGTTPDNILRAAKRLGLEAQSIAPMSLDELKGFLDKGRPVIIALQAWSRKVKDYIKTWSSGHYVVVVGYDEKKFYFEDPASANRTYLSHKELLQRWHDTDNVNVKYYNLGIVVLGKKKAQVKLEHMG